MKTIPFNTLNFRQLPMARVLKPLPKHHPLAKLFQELKSQQTELAEVGDAVAIATIHITMALQLAAYEN